MAVLKSIPDWFVTSKMFERFHDTSLAADVKSHFLLINWVFLVYIIIKLTLTMIIEKMILVLLLMSDFWRGLINLKNAKHLK